MIHFKLFKGSDRLADIDSILNEADSIIKKNKLIAFPKFHFKQENFSLDAPKFEMKHELKEQKKIVSKKKAKESAVVKS